MDYVDPRVVRWVSAASGERSRVLDWAAYDAARTAWRRGRVTEGQLLGGQLAVEEVSLLNFWIRNGDIAAKFTSLRPRATVHWDTSGANPSEIVQQMLVFRIEAFQAELDSDQCKWNPDKSSLSTWFRNGAVLQLPRSLRALGLTDQHRMMLLEPDDHLLDRLKGAWQRRDEQEYTDLIEEFLLQLPPRLRSFVGRFLRADLDEYPRQAAAELLGISRRTLGLRISEAKHHGQTWRRRSVKSCSPESERPILRSVSEGRGGRA